MSAPLEQVAEALIFSADEPVTGKTIASVYASVTGLDVPSGEEVTAAVEALNHAYVETGRAFRIHYWAGGYRMATEPQLAPFVKTLFAEQNERALSRSLMETLAIVAYKQPVTKPEVDFVRGVDSDYALRKLMERSFVEVIGRSEGVGKPLLYGTTPFFLDQFGLSALDDLPKPREIDELLSDPVFNRERELLLTQSEMTKVLEGKSGEETTVEAEDQ